MFCCLYNVPYSFTVFFSHTAYFGFLELCKPKEGEVVVISGAAGAVGSHVGQLAKLKGCRAVGITGSDEKGHWLVNELGFDSYVNYKAFDFVKKLEEVTPNGIDCYFDNVIPQPLPGNKKN